MTSNTLKTRLESYLGVKITNSLTRILQRTTDHIQRKYNSTLYALHLSSPPISHDDYDRMAGSFAHHESDSLTTYSLLKTVGDMKRGWVPFDVGLWDGDSAFVYYLQVECQRERSRRLSGYVFGRGLEACVVGHAENVEMQDWSDYIADVSDVDEDEGEGGDDEDEDDGEVDSDDVRDDEEKEGNLEVEQREVAVEHGEVESVEEDNDEITHTDGVAVETIKTKLESKLEDDDEGSKVTIIPTSITESTEINENVNPKKKLESKDSVETLAEDKNELTTKTSIESSNSESSKITSDKIVENNTDAVQEENTTDEDRLPLSQVFKVVDGVWDAGVQATAGVILGGMRITRRLLPW
jgi:hypothetical protein